MAATAVAAVIAVVPIVGAIIAGVGGTASPRTAFAGAPPGNYAVLVQAGSEADTIVVMPANDPRATTTIATVPHLSGYTSFGAVSPTGDFLALVTTDAGSVSRPVASLLAVELETGRVRKLASDIDYLQTPVWAPDGSSIVVTRSSGVSAPATDVSLIRVPLDGDSELALATASGVLGAYPVGIDEQGRFIYVVIDAGGSTAYGDGSPLVRLASGITRDWKLSPDGTTLAFIETSTADGVKYYARTAALHPSVSAQALAADDTTQALGVAWNPGSNDPTFGHEPGSRSDDISAQSLTTPGFDVPLGYSPDGSDLAVQHWSGGTFAQPGAGQLQVLASDGTRLPLDGFARFYGWATR